MEYVTQMAVACLGSPELFQGPISLESDVLYPWYALCVRQRQREQCEDYLASQSYQYFSPTRTEIHQWSDRKKTATLPLFPGYMFCRFDPQKSGPIMRAPGVMAIINSGGKLLEVDSIQIDNVFKSLQSGYNLDVIPDLVRGQRVRITTGAMTGVEGVLVMMKHQLRVGLEITMMNRTVLVEVNASQLLPL